MELKPWLFSLALFCDDKERKERGKGLIAVIKGMRDLGKLVSDGRLEFCGGLVVCQCLDAQEAVSEVESGQL